MNKLLNKFLDNCPSCSILGALISIATMLIGISIAVLTYSFFQKSDIDQAKKELEVLKKEYQLTLQNLKKVQDFSPEDYDAIDRDAFMHAHEALKGFKNIYIASAIIATKYGSNEDALYAWRQAAFINPDNRLCNYGLGMEYFKSAVKAKDKTVAKVFFEQSIKYLSHKSLSGHPQALYHLAIANLRSIDFKSDNKQKYELARQAIIVLNNTDKSKHPVGNVARNQALAYCLAGKYSPDKSLSQEYKNQSAKYFNEIHGLVDFDSFYDKFYKECTK